MTYSFLKSPLFEPAEGLLNLFRSGSLRMLLFEEPELTCQMGTVDPRITLLESPDQLFLNKLSELLQAFNEAAAAQHYDGRALAIVLTNPENHETLGGLWGHTAYSYLHVDAVFVPASLRGTGLGRKLVREAENEALRRGCIGAWLDTFSFQARGFYEKLGYQVFGALHDNPPGHTRFFLRKSLTMSA